METCDDHNLTCRETTVLVCGARDEPLTAEQAASLQQHLAGCTYCRAASRQFSDLFAQVDELFARDADPGA
jgi:predicted anti-sigma-YlaC factor YlaD